MHQKSFKTTQILLMGGMALSTHASAQSLPPDVRTGHWAATPVQAALRNHLLNLQPDKNFHGDAKVTHLQAVIALARLGQALESGGWQSSPSVPVNASKTGIFPKEGSWEKQPVTRYVFATVLTHMGDYAQNGIVRAKPTEKETGKSAVLPPPIVVKIPKSNPAYAGLTFLATHRMIAYGSALLTADDKPLQAAEMSRALKELVIGLTDRVTDIGHDADGNTHDESFHAKPPVKKN